MYNKKSFDLNNEEKKTNKAEKLYQPKQFRWCKCIVLPLLAGFMLLLILANVDFNGDAYDKTWQVTQTQVAQMQPKILEDPIELDKLDCIITADSCSVTCTGGNTNNMYKALEPPYAICGRDMDVILKDSEFPAGRLKSDFFEGNFRLKEVNIINSNLNSIDAEAFKHDAVKNLKNLYLINTQFDAMDKTTFSGLAELEIFQLINHHLSWANFKGIGFLENFSKSLKSLLITQMTINDIVYNPADWINGTTMSALITLDLSNNNFQYILNNETFSTLLAIEQLILANCKINYLPPNMFDNNLSTLRHIDLNGNQLTVLPGEMLLKMNGLNLNLNDNYWDCVCDNKEMLEILQSDINITFVEQEHFQCYTPSEKVGLEIPKLSLEECFPATTPPTTETTDMRTTVAVSDWSKSTESSSETSESSSSSGSSSSDTTESETSETSEETSESNETPTTTTINIPTENITTINPEVTTAKPWNTTITTSTIGTTTTTAIESTTTTTTTTRRPTTTAKTTTDTTSTTATSTTTTAMFPMYYVNCLKSNGKPYHMLLKQHSSKLFINPISRTSVQMSFSKTQNDLKVLYYPNYKTPFKQENTTEMPIFINNLDINSAYVFCLINSIKSEMSPFDCKSYYRPDIKAWILKDDMAWIVCLVVLGICLMLLLGIILIITVKRLRLDYKRKCLNKSSDTQLSANNQTVSDVPLRNFRDSQNSTDTLYHSQHQPPDVIATRPNCNMYNDLDIYEDLIM